MRAEISRLQRDLGVTTVYVTHDQTEAMTMGDRVAVMRGGELQQVADPQTLYERPANLFVAEFIGSPAMNLVKAELVRNGGLTARFGEHHVRVPERAGLGAWVGREIVLGVRPEDLEDWALAGGDAPTLEVVTDIREDLGSEVYVHFGVHAEPVQSREVVEALEEEAVEAIADRARRRGVPFVARLARASAAREGEAIRLAVDVDRLHFFDPETGAAIG
jgi:multiple sugar transport system ATP-binding protein